MTEHDLNADDVRSVLKHGHTESDLDYRHYHPGGDDPHHHRGPGAISGENGAMSDDDPYFGKVYDEDSYCVACGNGRWKHHMPQCQIADLIDALREARHILAEDEATAQSNLPYSQKFFDYLAGVDQLLAHIDGSGGAGTMEP